MQLPRPLRPVFLALFLTGAACAAALGIAALSVVAHFDGTAGMPEEGSGTCVIVFGAAVHRGDLPGPGIARRVETAVRLSKEGLLQHIILSGGKGGGGVASEAQVMRNFAIERGVDARLLFLEDQSRSTWENLAFSRPLTSSCTSVIGISDRYHLARISYLARLQGWGALRTLPGDREAPLAFEVQSVLRESVALLYYVLTLDLTARMERIGDSLKSFEHRIMSIGY